VISGVVFLNLLFIYLFLGESVVFDPEPACKTVFGTMVNAFYFRYNNSNLVLENRYPEVDSVMTEYTVNTPYLDLEKLAINIYTPVITPYFDPEKLAIAKQTAEKIAPCKNA
jgi:hypothetical protein